MVAAVSGILIATLIYGFGGGFAQLIARAFKPIHVLFFNKYFFDELYNRVFVQSALWLGRVFSIQGDGRLINGLGPDGLAKRSQNIARGLSSIQSGYVYHYAFVMILGLIAAVSWIFYKMVVSL